jgi:hypothetical protein
LEFTIGHIFLVVIYEIGTLQENHWNIRDYISSGWNILDVISSLLIIVAFYMLTAGYSKESITVGGLFVPSIMIASSAIPISLTILQPLSLFKPLGELIISIPISLTLLQSLSLFKPLGELIIMIKEMSFDVASFLLLYVICSFGFAVLTASITSLGIQNGDLIGAMLFLYSATLGNFDFEWNPYFQFLLAVYMLASAILLINLLIARMSTTYQRINDKALEEW